MSFAEIVFNIPLQQSFIYEIPANLDCKIGMRAMVPFRSRSRRGYIIALHNHNPVPQHTVLPIKKLIDEQPLFGSVMIKLAHWMATYYMCGLGECLAVMLPGAVRTPQALLPSHQSIEAHLISHSLSQQAALQHILTLPSQPLYLSGITGSGKSEVLLQATHEVIKKGGGVIMLAPEISLATQQATQLKERLGIQCALMHSRCTHSERLRQWHQLQQGELRCVVGARSAIFAPVSNLQLIIMDEEQDGAYKSSASPRYHTRHIAMLRAKWEQASLVMASATPSLEAWHHIGTGRIHHMELEGHPAGGARPDIQIVSLIGSRRIISDQLQEAIEKTLHSGQQTMLLLNRRGFGRTLVCRSCGFTKNCTRCSIPLVYHKKPAEMICHYCGYRTSLPTICPNCNSLDIAFVGYGTELVERELRQLFPTLRMARVDADTVRARDNLARILSEFSAHKLDLLLGTQMIAKGLNFRGVQLVGILLADTSLTLPDFRAEEYTYALITQIAGRTGRYNPQGKVIIQSYRPTNSAIVAAAAHDRGRFYQAEMQTRQRLSFPPFTRMIRMVIRGVQQSIVQKTMTQLAQDLKELANPPFDILGPAECPIARMARYWRMHLMVCTTAFNQTHQLLQPIVAHYRTQRGIYLEIDIDPVSML